jgi:hypothetical protein
MEPTVQTENLQEEGNISKMPQPSPLLPVEVQQSRQISIQININCSPSDIPGLGTQIKALIKEISGKATEDSNGEG